MPDIPQRISLVAQTKSVLVQGMAEKRWKDRLPSERALCEEFQISRGTLRAAMKILSKQKLVRIRHGQPCQILPSAAVHRARARLSRVACLTPDPLSRLPPFYMLWMDDLRARLQRAGVQLDLYRGARYFRPGGGRNLQKLVEQNPHSAWLLVLSTSALQRWYQKRGVPAIVAGSLHPGVRLPSVDNNFRAVGRHAGGMLLSRGHRRVAFLAPALAYGGIGPGTIEVERGLREVFDAAPRRDQELTVIYHQPDPGDICRAVDRLLGAVRRPTALLIAYPTTLLTTITHLVRSKVSIPGDLSLVVTHDEPFFAHIVPALTHYEWSPEKFAQQYRRLLGQALADMWSPDPCVRLMPRFVLGQTLASPP